MWFRAAPGVLSSLATLLLDLSVRERWHLVASEARWLSVGPGTTPAVKGRVIVKSGRPCVRVGMRTEMAHDAMPGLGPRAVGDA